jgi:hypothetical protein
MPNWTLEGYEKHGNVYVSPEGKKFLTYEAACRDAEERRVGKLFRGLAAGLLVICLALGCFTTCAEKALQTLGIPVNEPGWAALKE